MRYLFIIFSILFFNQLNAQFACELCNGETKTIGASAVDVALFDTVTGYAWSSGESTQTIVVSSTGTYTITVTGTSGGCAATGTLAFDITVNPLPTCTAGSNSPVCEGETINLTESGGDAISWSWSGPGSFTSTSQNPSRSNATLAMAGTYTVEITDTNGCVSTCTTDVVVNPEVTINITGQCID